LRAAIVNVSMAVQDDVSGIAYAQARFVSPSNVQARYCNLDVPYPARPRTLEGTCTVPFPQYGEGGTWRVETVFLQDDVGNYRYLNTADLQALGYPTTLEVASVQDVTAPTLATFSFAPSSIDTGTGPASVTVSMSLQDDLSGIAYAQARFVSPSNVQARYCNLDVPYPARPRTLEGTCAVPFPQYGEGGTWRVETVFLQDDVGNYRYFNTADLQALGFLTTLTVTSGP
jgi:hypothetical protein